MRYLLIINLLFFIESSIAAGPQGLGSIKIGMSKNDIESIAISEHIRLASPLKTYESKYSQPILGSDEFSAEIFDPFGGEPLKSTLTFEDKKLSRISIPLGESTDALEKFKKQIISKYGDPIIDNRMKEEQCIYKNGSNFKLSSGSIYYRWIENFNSQSDIETFLMIGDSNSCPDRLSYGAKLYRFTILSIRLIKKPDETKIINPF